MKLKRFLILILLFFSCYNIFSQTKEEVHSLFLKCNECFDNGDYNSTIKFCLEAIPLYENLYGKTHLFTADVYALLGLTYFKIYEYKNSLFWYEEAYKIFNGKNGDKKSAELSIEIMADIYCTIANNMFEKNNYSEALENYYKELNLRLTISKKNTKDFANCYANIGLAYEFINNFNDALSNFKIALSIRKEIFGENSLEISKSYYDIGCLYYKMGNYKESLDYQIKCFDIREQLLGSDSLETVEVIQAIITDYIELQNYATALELSEYIENIYNTIQVLPISEEFAILYNERSRIYYNLSEYKNALDLVNKALEINLNLYGEEYYNTLLYYHNIATTYQAMGDYSRAIALLEKVISISKSSSGNFDNLIALSYKSLGAVYRSINDWETAYSYFNLALKYFQNLYGEKYIDVARCYLEIALYFRVNLDYENSLSFYRKANDIFFEIFGYETVEIAETYSGIGFCYEQLGYVDDAEFLYKSVLRIYINIFGENNIHTTLAYMDLGWFYIEIGKVKDAINCFKSSYQWLEDPTNYKQIIYSLLTILQNSKRYHYDTEIDFIRDTISILCNIVEKARLDMNSIKSDILEYSLDAFYYAVDFEIRNKNLSKAFEYSESLRNRSFLDQIGLDRSLSLNGITDSDKNKINKLIKQISENRKEIEKQNSLSITNRDTKKFIQAEKDLSNAEKELLKFDEYLGNHIPGYAQLRNPQTIKLTEAQRWCGKNRAILEYVMYEPEDSNYEPYFYCIILTNNKITTVQLESGFDYNYSISSLRQAITHHPIKSEITFEKNRNELYDKLVKPILPYIKNVKNVVIVPDGSLSFLPFDILRENSTSDDFGKKYALSFSPSISVSLIANNIKSLSKDFLSFYGAWYDKTLSEEEHSILLTLNTQNYLDRGNASLIEQNSLLSESELRNIIENDGSAAYFEQKKLNWLDLPGTVLEVKNIKETIFLNGSYKSQKEASELKLKELSKQGELSKYSILHFACHGYYDPDLSEMSSVLFSEVSGKLDDVSNEDGYLTVGEASALNLSADMVCLSACQTGLGKIQKGNGMVGLSRAFMVAGARNVGVTLWCVDDNATAEFMLKMYKKVKNGMSYSEAYRKVKNEFRDSDDYNHPYYWAAFTLYE